MKSRLKFKHFVFIFIAATLYFLSPQFSKIPVSADPSSPITLQGKTSGTVSSSNYCLDFIIDSKNYPLYQYRQDDDLWSNWLYTPTDKTWCLISNIDDKSQKSHNLQFRTKDQNENITEQTFSATYNINASAPVPPSNNTPAPLPTPPSAPISISNTRPTPITIGNSQPTIPPPQTDPAYCFIYADNYVLFPFMLNHLSAVAFGLGPDMQTFLWSGQGFFDNNHKYKTSWYAISPGNYTLQAIVSNSAGQTTTCEKTFTVLSPITPPPPDVKEYPVDIFIHKSLDNQRQVEGWARNTVDNYYNTLLAEAGVKMRVRVNNVFFNYDDQGECPDGGIKSYVSYGANPSSICNYTDNSIIRAWLYKYQPGYPYGTYSSYATPWNAQFYLNITSNLQSNNSFSDTDRWTFAHEMSHDFGLPDYYQEVVPSYKNKVYPLMGIEPYAKDLMLQNFFFEYFSKTSRGFFEKVTSLPVGFFNQGWNYTPGNISLKFTDSNNNSLHLAKIEVFPSINWDQGVYGNRDQSAISPDTISFTGTTNENGVINLGERRKIFTSSVAGAAGTIGASALIRVTKDEKVYYLALTRSYLNTLYFQGLTNRALVPVKLTDTISSLPELPLPPLPENNNQTPLSPMPSITTNCVRSDLDPNKKYLRLTISSRNSGELSENAWLALKDLTTDKVYYLGYSTIGFGEATFDEKIWSIAKPFEGLTLASNQEYLMQIIAGEYTREGPRLRDTIAEQRFRTVSCP